MPRWPVRLVSAQELRERFNAGGYDERAQAGELLLTVGYNHHPCPDRVNEPYCTRSQRVEYIDPQAGRTVAWAHRYLHMDGTLGASGRPDPKAVWDDGVIYRLRAPEPG
jgi:hypothetical protein